MQYPEGALGGMALGPAGGAQGVAPLLVRPVRTDEVVHWDRLMAAHHYLGVRRLVGESLRYVAEQGGQWVALLGWGSAAFKCASRDRWIGWTPEQQWRRLRYVANNLRFLVLPDARRRVGGRNGAGPKARGGTGGATTSTVSPSGSG